MKILMLTPYLPYPPASGGQIRTLYLLKYLSKFHSVTLVSLYKDESEKKYAKHLKEFCEDIYLCKRPKNPWQISNILNSVFTTLPFLIVRNYSVEAVVTIKKLITTKKFDIIHAETFYIMPHIPKTNVPILLVEQTIEYKVYQHFIKNLPFYLRIPLNVDILKLKLWEKHYWNKANLVATVSKHDKLEIKKIVPEIEPEIIQNGAGDEMFLSSEKKFNKNKSIKLLFMGNFYWLQNVEAANYLINEIYPIINKKIKNVFLQIAGQNISKKLNLKKQSNIEFIELKASDINSVKNIYKNADLFIAPIFGPGGTRLKILASMASKVPVISTSVGVEGLDVKNETHFLHANTTEEFINQILKITSNVNLYYKIQKNAYIHISENFSWESIAEKLEKVYQKVIKNT